MNGFNKGLETIYSSEANLFTDATAIHGLRLFREGLLRLSNNEGGMDECVAGLILVQFERNTNIIHAFGHGFARRYPVQQGHIHAIIVPHVLRYLFSKTDARRHSLAEGLGIETETLAETSVGERIIEEVTKIRDSFGLPSRLSDLDSIEKRDFPGIARFILSDKPMDRGPQSVHMSEAEIITVLENAW
jgi:alcohol dehydrogenase